MKTIIKSILLLVMFTAPSYAQLSLDVGAITTGLRWENGTVDNYSGTAITASNNGGETVAWTILDANSIDHTTDESFGKCVLSGANDTICTYEAPFEYPPGRTATISATTSTQGTDTATVTYQFAFNLEEYWIHRARFLNDAGFFSNKPVTDLEVATSPRRFQPELIVFDPQVVTFTNGTGVTAPNPSHVVEIKIPQLDSDVQGSACPAGGGSGINRPCFTYNGKWITWNGRRCIDTNFCSATQRRDWIVRTDGSDLQRLAGIFGSNSQWMFSDRNPDYIFYNDTTNIYGIDLAVSAADSTKTSVATYSGALRRIFSFPVEGFFLFRHTDIDKSTAISAFTYDMTSCEDSGLTGGCATLADSWSTSITTGLVGWTAGTGTAHDTAEFRIHDIHLQRGVTNPTSTFYLPGPAAAGGEPIFFLISEDGTTDDDLAPDALKDIPYTRKLTLDVSGNYGFYIGQDTCNETPPSSKICLFENEGVYVMDFTTNAVINSTTAMPLADAGAHTTWDGYSFYRGGFTSRCKIGGVNHQCLTEARLKPSEIIGTQVLDAGTRATAATAFTYFLGPSQSADATKLTMAFKTTHTDVNQFLLWLVQTNHPAPPIQIRMVSSNPGANTATIGWFANALNRECRRYHLYRSADLSSWTRLASVNCVFPLNGGSEHTQVATITDGQTFYYGLASEEWAGLESDLSGVLKIVRSGATFTPTIERGAGTTRFDASAPANVTVLTTTQEAIGTPAIPESLSQGSGGSLADGTYWFRVTWCNFSDFPANATANAKCTAAGTIASLAVSGGGGTASISFGAPENQMFGQVAVRIYGEGPSASEPPAGNFKLQTCSGESSTAILPWPPNGTPTKFDCTINSIAAGAAPGTDNTVQGYTLAWTKPADTDLRHTLIYYRDDAPPIVSGDEAQKYLIATVPPSTTSFLDYLINQFDAGSARPYYGLVTVDRLGNKSAGVCRRTNPDASATCN